MTGKGWSHFRKKVHHEEWLYPYSVISSGGSMLSDYVFKIATATMSREISQINDYDGVFKDRFEN